MQPRYPSPRVLLQTDFNLRNAHTFCSRDKAEEGLVSDIMFNYMLETFQALYGKNGDPLVVLRGQTRQTPNKLLPLNRGYEIGGRTRQSLLQHPRGSGV